MTPASLAFFDDFSNADLGHHPELVQGLAAAAATLRPSGDTPFFCPSSFVADRVAAPGTRHYACEASRPYRRDGSRGTMRRAAQTAADAGATALVNLFLDENYRSLPLPDPPLRLAHILHRPGPRPRGPRSRRPNLRHLPREDVVVVHTERGMRHARELVEPAMLVRAGWPTITRAQLADRFAGAPWRAAAEPHVLLIGEARDDKGVPCLLEALAGGPPLVVVGEQVSGYPERLSVAHPRARIEWRAGWMPKARIDAAIADAAAVVLPYEEAFAVHAGPSAALAQALAHPKPVILSTLLADQAPVSDACLPVPPRDARALRAAIDHAVRDAEQLHFAAADRLAHVEREHTYEAHVERLIERLSA